MKQTAYTQKYPSLSATYVFIFIIGLACMAVAGYFLIAGLSQFSGSDAAKRMLIIGGILFQITESICFISASALTYHSLRWRYTLFGLGIVLFSFSIGVMTLAQKTALQTGEAQAQAIDEKREYIRQQITSLDQVIASYRFNAEKQSKSIYKDSRALGQDSLNRASALEEKKILLSEELFGLNEKRRQTSADFFKRLEDILGLPAKSTEFYFLVLRSLLLELCGIILMSFGANLRAYKQLVMDAQVEKVEKTANQSAAYLMPAEPNSEEHNHVETAKSVGSSVSLDDNQPTTPSPHTTTKQIHIEPAPDSEEIGASNSDSTPEDETPIAAEINNAWASPKIRKLQLKQNTNTTDSQLQYLSTMAADLYDQKLISDLNAKSIYKGLLDHCQQNVSKDVAEMLSRILLSRQEELC